MARPETTLQQLKERIARYYRLWSEGKISEAEYNAYRIQATTRYFDQAETGEPLPAPPDTTTGAVMPPGLNTLPIGPGGGGGQTIPTAPVYPTNQTPYGATQPPSSEGPPYNFSPPDVPAYARMTLDQFKSRIALLGLQLHSGKISESEYNAQRAQIAVEYFAQPTTPSTPSTPSPVPTLTPTPTPTITPSTYPNRVQPPKAAQPSAPTYPATEPQPEGRPKKYQYPTYNRQPYGWLRKGNFSWW